ncbi:uncharacterized protein LOC135817082 [Sycon ciliatum]|uniref:uncharacterized protein LOC135817082 n=1 Tax=Sycon ciliatum TaxID=27933 RepID=UPI0031F60D25
MCEQGTMFSHRRWSHGFRSFRSELLDFVVSLLLLLLCLSVHNGCSASPIQIENTDWQSHDLYSRRVHDNCPDQPSYCPPRQANVTVHRINETAVRLMWIYVPGASPLQIGVVANIELRLTSIYEGAIDIAIPASRTAYTVTSLIPGVNYRLQTSTFNSNGETISEDIQLESPEYLESECVRMTAGQECVASGGNALFKCSARGGPLLGVEWPAVPSAVIRQQPVTGGQNLYIDIRNVSIADNGRTYCLTSTTPNKRQRACFTLCVRERIQISCRKTRPCARRHDYHQSLTLSCTVSGQPTPNVTWRFNGRVITSRESRGNEWHLLNTRPGRLTQLDGDFTPQSPVVQHRLRTELTHHDYHTGTVLVSANNGFEKAKVVQDIIITWNPSEMVQVVKMTPTIELDDPFHIRCKSFIGLSDQHFSWYFTPAGSKTKTRINPGQNGALIGNSAVVSNLHIRAANTSHSGVYECLVKNRYGCSESSFTRVKVKASLLTRLNVSDSFVFNELHRPATVSCMVTAAIKNQPLTVHWYLNSKDIHSAMPAHSLSRPPPVVHMTSWRAQLVPSYVLGNQYRYDVTTNNLSISDLGELRCVATLENKRHESSTTLLARGVVVVVTDSRRAIKVKRNDRVQVSCTVFSNLSEYRESDVHQSFRNDVLQSGWLVRTKTQRVPQPVGGRTDMEVRNESRSLGAGVHMKKITMTIRRFQASHEGLYMCRAPAEAKRRLHNGSRMQAVVRLKLDNPVANPPAQLIMFT